MKTNAWIKKCRRVGKAVLSCLIAGGLFMNAPLPFGTKSNVAAAAAPLVVSTWMWNPYSIGNDRDNTLQQLTDRNVNRVYLFIDPSYPVNYYKSFIKEAGVRGIQVHALSGAPTWVLPEYNKKMYEYIYWVKQYNANALPEERFAGIHIDVEPYVLSQWRQDSDAVMGLWMDTVSGFVQEVKADSTLAVSIDMPVWLDYFKVRDGYGGMTTLANWMIRRVDQVTLMAYSDNAKSIEESVQNEIAEADRLGVPVLVAVETVNNDEPGSSFYSKGETMMKSELTTVIDRLTGHASFKGYSIHEWDSWTKMFP